MVKRAKNTPKKTGKNTNSRKSIKERFKANKGADLPASINKVDINLDATGKLSADQITIHTPILPDDITSAINQSCRRVLRDHTKNEQIIAKIAQDVAKTATDTIKSRIMDAMHISPIQQVDWIMAEEWSISTGAGDQDLNSTNSNITNSTMSNSNRSSNSTLRVDGQEAIPSNTIKKQVLEGSVTKEPADGSQCKPVDDPLSLSKHDVVMLLKDLISKAKQGDTTTGDAVRVADLVAKFGGMYGQLDTEVIVNIVQYKSDKYNQLKALE